MSTQQEVKERGRRTAGDDTRERLLSGLPVTERRVQVAGVSTAVLEGGDGPPIVLLQGEFAAVWMRVIPELVRTHRVIAPDLPGLGASHVPNGPPGVDTVLTWVGELIAQPDVDGFLVGGASLDAGKFLAIIHACGAAPSSARPIRRINCCCSSPDMLIPPVLPDHKRPVDPTTSTSPPRAS